MDSLPKDWMDGYDAGYAASERELDAVIADQDEFIIEQDDVIVEQNDQIDDLKSELDLAIEVNEKLSEDIADLANRNELLTSYIARFKGVFGGLQDILSNEQGVAENALDTYGSGTETYTGSNSPGVELVIEEADDTDEVPF